MSAVILKSQPSVLASGIESLPSDLLLLILDYIPFRPRMLVLSTVSSKFNQLSFQSVTTIPMPMSERIREQELVRFTNLTELHVTKKLLSDAAQGLIGRKLTLIHADADAAFSLECAGSFNPFISSR